MRDQHSGTRVVPKGLQQQAFRRDNLTCRQCGHVGSGRDGTLHADHVTNRASGGADSLDNLMTLCEHCHSVKSRHEAIQGQRARIQRGYHPRQAHPGMLPPPPRRDIPPMA